jgi:hypothetical protein
VDAFAVDAAAMNAVAANPVISLLIMVHSLLSGSAPQPFDEKFCVPFWVADFYSSEAESRAANPRPASRRTA